MSLFPLNTLHLRLFHWLGPRIRRYKYFFLPNLRLGRNVCIFRKARLDNWNGGSITIGDNTIIESYAMVLTMGGNIVIGSDCTINPYTIIYGQGGCKIGDGVRIAAHCTIIPSNHIYNDANLPIFKQGLDNKGIIIEDDVWIGSGVRVLDGVHIARGCVIGAGSVVTRDTEPYSVYVGIPAKKIKNRIVTNPKCE